MNTPTFTFTEAVMYANTIGSTGWVPFIADDRVHVMPVNDLREHLEYDCWCCPEIEDEPDRKLVIIHNAMDLRQQYEEGQRLPS